MKLFRTIISVLLVVTSITFISPTASAQEVLTKDQAAQYLKNKGLLQGDNGDLMLDKTLTREEMMVIVSRFLGVEDEAINYPADSMTFKDVPKTSWAAAYVAWAQDNAITEGHSPEQFGFKESLTGWQTEAFLVRALGYYPSDDEIEVKANDLGIMKNISVGSKAPILRRDMALLMYNTLGAKTERGQVLGEVLGMFELPPVSDDVLKNVITDSTTAAQEEDVNKYLETVYLEDYLAPGMTDFLETLFNSYDLKYEIESIKVIEKDGISGLVEVVQTTKKVSGPEFSDNREKVQYLIEKFGDTWKITETQIISYEVIK